MKGSIIEDKPLRETNRLEAEEMLFSNFDKNEKIVYSFIVTNTATYNTAAVLGSGGVPNMIGGYNLKAKIIITSNNFYLLQWDAFNNYLSHNKIPFNDLLIKLEGKYFKLFSNDKLLYQGIIHDDNKEEILNYLGSKNATISENKYKKVLTWIRNNKGLAFIMILFSYIVIAPIFQAIGMLVEKLISLF